MVGEGVGVGVAVCVTAPEVFNPAWRQNLPRVYGACESLLNVETLWCIGMLLGVWGNVCCSLVTISRDGNEGFSFLVLCGGGVVCVNCIVDACDFFFVHVLVFLKLLVFFTCVFCF